MEFERPKEVTKEATREFPLIPALIIGGVILFMVLKKNKVSKKIKEVAETIKEKIGDDK
jgi:hypothetical protein